MQPNTALGLWHHIVQFTSHRNWEAFNIAKSRKISQRGKKHAQEPVEAERRAKVKFLPYFNGALSKNRL
jgi:hypothetical protein